MICRPSYLGIVFVVIFTSSYSISPAQELRLKSGRSFLKSQSILDEQGRARWEASTRGAVGAGLAAEGQARNRPSNKRVSPNRIHWVVAYPGMPSASDLKTMEQAGLHPVEYIPDNAWIVSGDGAAAGSDSLAPVWGRLLLSDKVSPALQADLTGSPPADSGVAQDIVAPEGLVEDVSAADARAVVQREGLPLVENPSLSTHHLLVRGGLEAAWRLADWDEVAYVFPASRELMQGEALYLCEEALTGSGPVGQYIASVGDGWDGAGANAVRLGYYWGAFTSQVPVELAHSEALRAMSEWANYIQLTLTQKSQPGQNRTIDVQFVRGDHGDGYPFDGPGQVLAHTFYPAPPNPEPLAGDMHMDADETWQVGADLDIYSVVVHEMGHALGLAHSDVPGSVMYPYYRRSNKLAADDIASIQRLYAARSSDPGTPDAPPSSPDDPPTTPDTPSVPDPPTPPMPPDPPDTPDTPSTPSTPVVVQIVAPASTGVFQTGTPTVVLAGTAGGGAGIVSVSWIASTGAQGTASGTSNWSTGAISLEPGATTFTVTAADSQGAKAFQSLQVVYTPAPPSGDTIAPSLEITYPYSTSVATTSASLTIQGRASDNVGVTAVRWTNSTGSSGDATGTTNWTTGPIALPVGINMITIRATDAAGNQSWRSLSVRRR
jgi:Matrixin